MEPGEDTKDVSRLQGLRDTLRAEISELAKTADSIVESPAPKIGTLKTLLESLNQKLDHVTSLDNQIRNLLDDESYEKDYEESDEYLSMIFCTKWLLKERISKMSLIRPKVITKQATIDNHARRPSATVPQVAPLATSFSPLVTSPAARDKVSEYADGSLIMKTTMAETTPLSAGDLTATTSATPLSRRDCVQPQKEQRDQLSTQLPEPLPDSQKPAVSTPVISNGEAMNTNPDRRTKQNFGHKATIDLMTARPELQMTTTEGVQERRARLLLRQGTSNTIMAHKRKRQLEKAHTRSSQRDKIRRPKIANYFTPLTEQSFVGLSFPVLNKTVTRKRNRSSKHRWRRKRLTSCDWTANGIQRHHGKDR